MSDWPNPDEWNLAPLDHTISGKFLLDDCDLCVRIRDLEARCDEFEKIRDEFTRRGFHRCGSDTTLCYCAHMDEDLVSEHGTLRNENASNCTIRAEYRKEVDALKTRVAKLEAVK